MDIKPNTPKEEAKERMDVKEYSCATGNLVDISFTDPMYGTKQQVEAIDISPLRENKVSLIDMDDKQLFTPQCIVKTLSPRSMSSISLEASRVISKLHDSEIDLESTLLADELFPMRLSFDNVSFEEAPSKDVKITPFQNKAEISPELQIPSILNLSNNNNIEASPLSEEVNQIAEEFHKEKTTPVSNSPTDGKDELLVEKSVEFNKSPCCKTNFSSLQKRSYVERQVHELQKSNKICLPERISKKTLSTPKATKLVKPMSHVSKNNNDEKENAFANGNDKDCNLKKPHSNSITPQVNKAFDYEHFQKSNIKPLINDAIYSGAELRQVLSPIKNTTIARNYLLKRKILTPSESLTTSKLVFSEQGSNASHTSKPRELGFQKPTCKNALRVPPPDSVYTLQRSNSFQVTRLRELHMKQEQPLSQKSVQRSTSACSSMDKNKVKMHLMPPAVGHSMKGTPAKLTAYQSGKKLLTPQYNRRPIDLSASFNATPFRTPLSTRILPPASGSSNRMLALPSTPLSSKDKLSRRLSFVPTQLLSAGKKKSG